MQTREFIDKGEILVRVLWDRIVEMNIQYLLLLWLAVFVVVYLYNRTSTDCKDQSAP